MAVALLSIAASLAAVSVTPPAAQALDGEHGEGAAPALKPALQGLVVTQPKALATVPYAEFGSMKLPWNTIETRPGIYDFSAVDQAITANPDVQFRLRFMAGIHAPQWVKDGSGGCVWVEPNSINGNSGCVPRYWTDAFHADYVALMRAVARRYESNPQVVEIANSECTTIYAEPFILGADTESIDRLWRAGYTKAAHEICLRRSTRTLMDLFPTTRVSLAGHSKWQFIVPGRGGPGDGTFAASWEDERGLLNDLIAAYGARLVLEDHGLGPDDAACPTPGQSRATATDWYCYMSGLHDSPAPYGWQFTLNGGSMAMAADAGVGMGACYLEFAAFQSLDENKRRAVHESLVANCADAGTDPDPGPDPDTTVINQTAPQVAGSPRVGQTLTASDGTWSPQPEQVEHQWLRDGQPIAAATGPTYVVRQADAGHRLAVRTTASHADLLDGRATSQPVRVARLATRTRAWLPQRRTHSHRPAVVVRVFDEDGPVRGKVVVTKHGRRVGAGWLHDGRLRLRVHRLRSGGHRLVARYQGTETMQPSRSAPMRVVVRR